MRECHSSSTRASAGVGGQEAPKPKTGGASHCSGMCACTCIIPAMKRRQTSLSEAWSRTGPTPPKNSVVEAELERRDETAHASLSDPTVSHESIVSDPDKDRGDGVRNSMQSSMLCK